MASRNWLFTINNPEAEDYPEQWSNLTNIKNAIYQVEMGEEGTIHLQGYLELKNPRQMVWLRRNLNGRAHWEKRRGTRRQAVEYCAKEETRLAVPSVYGMRDSLEGWTTVSDTGLESLLCELGWRLNSDTSQNGSESSKKLHEIKAKLEDGSASLEDIADEYFPLWVRYNRAFEKFVTMKTAPRDHACEVHVIFGPTGTGKSRWCMDQFPGAYWKQRSKWWDGYFKHETVVLDEYYGWIQFDTLLRICDRYPMLVESKGGQIQFVAKSIIFTTNKLPCEWYSNCYFPAFQRRVTKWHYMPSLGIHSIHENYSEFKAIIDNRN